MRVFVYAAVAAVVVAVWALAGCVPNSSVCTKTVPAGTSFSSAMSGTGPGDTVCLSDGTYNWGDFSPPAGRTILAPAGRDATVVGQARVSQNNVRLWNLTMRAAPNENHSVVYVTGDGFTAANLEVDAANVNFVQGFLMVGANDAKILDSVVHSVRGQGCFSPGTGSRVHAIYWAGGTNGEIGRVWMYDISGFGLHFYSGAGGSAAGTQVHHTITDDTLCGLGNVFDSIAGPTAFNETVITDAGPWSCRSSGATVSNSRSQQGFSGCSGAGNVTADTVYEDEETRDYRVVGDPDFQFVPGPG